MIDEGADTVQQVLDQVPKEEWLAFLAWMEDECRLHGDREMILRIAAWRLRHQLI